METPSTLSSCAGLSTAPNLVNLKAYEYLSDAYGKSLVDAELQLESESQYLGMARLEKTFANDLTNSGASQRVLSNAVPTLGNRIREWLDEVNNKSGGGRKHSAAVLIQLGDADTIAYITLSTIFTCVFTSKATKYYNFSVVASKIANALEDEFRFRRVLSNLDKQSALRTQAGLDKRVGISYKKAFIRAIENNSVESGKLEAWEKWTATAKLNVGIKLIELAAEATGLLDITLLTDTNNSTSYALAIRDEIMEAIEKNNKVLISLGFVNRPMVIPPKPWTAPLDGGYYIDLKSPNPFIRMPKGKLLAMYSDVEMPNVYAAVNAIQATAWRVNTKVLKIAKIISQWQCIPDCLDFPSNEPAEKPIRPPEADSNPELHDAWKASMLHYYQQDNTRKGKRLSINALIALADTYKDYDAIYFPHNIDFRGRVYPLTILSPQGNDFGKSLIEFSKGKPVGKQGAKWLAFHGANCYGLDKRPMDERFKWAYDNEQLITGIASDPLSNTQWMEADSPWEFLAWCFEWAEYLKQGDSFESRIPVAFDGSCSGLQHYSAMLRDPVGGKAVNLVPSDSVQDIYKLVSDEVMKTVENDAANGTEDSQATADDGSKYTKLGTKALAKEWLKHGIDRYVTKRSVMTLPYGSKRFGFKDQVLVDTIYPALAKDAHAFIKPNQSAVYMAELIWNAVHKVVVKAMEAMEWLQDTSALLASQRGLDGKPIPIYWITPAGFPVHQAYEKFKLKQIHTVIGKGLTIKDPMHIRASTNQDAKDGTTIYPAVKEVQQGTLDSRKQRSGIAPNFVHSMDASHLMLTVLACKAKGVDSFAMIHDSYGTHAADAEIMFHTVREVFVNTYLENDVLRNIYEQVKIQLPTKALKKLKEPPVYGDLDLRAVLDSKYAFS